MFVEQTVVVAHGMIAMALLAMRMAAGRGYWLVLLMVMSATDRPLGWLTCLAGVKNVLPLVAALFVLVEALDRTGGIALVARAMG